MPIATRKLVPSQRSSAQPISPQASTPATKVPRIDQTASAPPPRRPPPPPRPAMGARIYHLRAAGRRDGPAADGAHGASPSSTETVGGPPPLCAPASLVAPSSPVAPSSLLRPAGARRRPTSLHSPAGNRRAWSCEVRSDAGG